MESLQQYVGELFDDTFGAPGHLKPLTGRDARDIVLVVVSELIRRLLERSIKGEPEQGVMRLDNGAVFDVGGLEGAILVELLSLQRELIQSKVQESEAILFAQAKRGAN